MSNTNRDRGEFIFIGLASAITQAVFLRQLVGMLGSSEILYAMIVTVWLVEAGVFSLLFGRIAKHLKGDTASVRTIIYIFLVVLTVYYRLVPGIRGMFEDEFGLVSISRATLIAAVVLIPPTIFAGGAFAVVWEYLKKHSAHVRVDKSYALDSIGFAIGGLIAAVVFVAGAYDGRLLLTVSMAGIALLMLRTKGRFTRLLMGGAALLSVGLIIILSVNIVGELINETGSGESFVYSDESKDGEIRVRARSPYGHVSLVSGGNSISFYYNSQRIVTVPDPIDRELPALGAVMADKMESALIVGNSVDGKAVFLVNNSRMDVAQLEIDPVLCRFFELQYSDSLKGDVAERFRLIRTLPNDFLLNEQRKFDLVYLNYPEISSSATGVYFTHEFLSLVRSNMDEGGVLAFSLESGENFIPNERLRLMKNIKETAESVFDSVLIIPGETAMFVCGMPLARLSSNSDSLLKRIDNLDGEYFALPAYLPDRLSDFRVEKFNKLLSGVEGETIHSGKPDHFLMNTILEMDRFDGVDSRILRGINNMSVATTTLLAIGPVVVFLIAGLLINHLRAMPLLFVSGWISMSAEVLILVLYQTVAGSLYSRIALITGSFMVGITGGAILAVRFRESKGRASITVSLVIAAVISLFVALGTPSLAGDFDSRLVVEVFLFILSLLFGSISGFMFNRSAVLQERISGSSVPGLVYGLDLLGAAVGGIAGVVVVLPVLGISTGFWIMGAMSFCMALYALKVK